MPFIKDMTGLIPNNQIGATGSGQVPQGELTMDAASIIAFKEDRENADTPVPVKAVTWVAARSPTIETLKHRWLPKTPVPVGFQRVGFTGIVDMEDAVMYLCPLVGARESGKYQGPLRHGKRDLTPIDHYAGGAIDAMVNKKGAGEEILADLKTDKNLKFDLGKKPILGGHRVPGTRPSNSNPGATTLDAGDNSLGFWESAGHQQLAGRLGLAKERCVGFAIEKNSAGPGIHKVMYVSRLNQRYFGVRGMSVGFSDKILRGLLRWL